MLWRRKTLFEDHSFQVTILSFLEILQKFFFSCQPSKTFVLLKSKEPGGWVNHITQGDSSNDSLQFLRTLYTNKFIISLWRQKKQKLPFLPSNMSQIPSSYCFYCCCIIFHLLALTHLKFLFPNMSELKLNHFCSSSP